MLFQKFLKLSSCFFFSFSWFDWVISTSLSSKSLSHSSTSSNLLTWFLQVYHSLQVIVFFSIDWFFFMFSPFLLRFSLCSFISLLSLASIFMNITLNSLSGRSLITILFSSFSEALSCCIVWNIFLCLLIFPNFLCWFLYVRIRCLSWFVKNSFL